MVNHIIMPEITTHIDERHKGLLYRDSDLGEDDIQIRSDKVMKMR
jgi:hypothetical protein